MRAIDITPVIVAIIASATYVQGAFAVPASATYVQGAFAVPALGGGALKGGFRLKSALRTCSAAQAISQVLRKHHRRAHHHRRHHHHHRRHRRQHHHYDEEEDASGRSHTCTRAGM